MKAREVKKSSATGMAELCQRGLKYNTDLSSSLWSGGINTKRPDAGSLVKDRWQLGFFIEKSIMICVRERREVCVGRGVCV